MKTPAALIAAILALLCLVRPVPAEARLVGPKTARTVAENRLAHHVLEFGSWAGSTSPEIVAEETLRRGDTVAGYNFPVSPRGHILVPADDALPPVKLFSEESTLSFGMNGEGDADGSRPELRAWITDVLYQEVKGLEGFDAAPARVDPDVEADRAALWTLYMTDPPIFPDALADFGEQGRITTVGPLLKTAWEQDDPYNIFNPEDADGCRTRAGSAPMALAQAMKHFNHPETGRGEHSYEWREEKRTAVLRRDFAASRYYWDYMPKSGSSSSSEEEQNALGGLALDAGVALSAQFGCERTSATILEAPEALREYFDYPSAVQASRDGVDSDGAWYDLMAGEFQAGRPVLFEAPDSTGETVSAVADGSMNLPPSIHLNMALDRNYRGWLAADDIELAGENQADSRNQRAVTGIAPSVRSPIPVFPLNGDAVANATVRFLFEEPPDNGFSHYNLWIKGPDGPFSDDWAEKDAICSEGRCAVIPSRDLDKPGQFQWAVRGFKDEGEGQPGSWSPINNFTALAPDTPLPLAPVGNVTAPPVAFAWTPVNGSSGYRITVSRDNETEVEFAVESRRTCRNGTCTAALAELESGAYVWTVEAQGIGTGSPSNATSFTLLRTGIPGAAGNGALTDASGPETLFPEGGARLETDRPVFAWLPLQNATDYRLSVSGPLGLADLPRWLPAKDICTQDGCSAKLNATLVPDGNYSWTVQARDSRGPGYPSPSRPFVIAAGKDGSVVFPASPPENSTLKAPATDSATSTGTGPAPIIPSSARPAPRERDANSTPLLRITDPDAPTPIQERPRKVLNIKKGNRTIQPGNDSRKPLIRITS